MASFFTAVSSSHCNHGALLLVLPVLALATACADKPAPAWSGYAEAEYVMVAAPLAGTLTVLAVKAGQTVALGAPLFTLDSDSERLAREEADARLVAAQAQAANATKGRRSEEIAVTQAQLAQARAAAELAADDLSRQQQLVEQGFISKARLDDARTALTQARAHVAELQAALAVAQLPARIDERATARAQAEAAQQALRQSQWREQQKQQSAPVAAQVADTFYRVGEWVNAGAPVVSLLPDGATKARFFVPQADLASVAPGQTVTLHCDGCGAPIGAHVERVATQPEFTPPVIYSNSQRAKLVFMVEARPSPDEAKRLRPGQPLDVRRAATGP
jgi:HlyD family secretion protein